MEKQFFSKENLSIAIKLSIFVIVLSIFLYIIALFLNKYSINYLSAIFPFLGAYFIGRDYKKMGIEMNILSIIIIYALIYLSVMMVYIFILPPIIHNEASIYYFKSYLTSLLINIGLIWLGLWITNSTEND